MKAGAGKGRRDPARDSELGALCCVPFFAAYAILVTFHLDHLLGRSGDAELVDLGLASLDRDFGDTEHGGWFPRRDAEGRPAETKTAYEHAFVLLAASSATIAGRPGAEDLLSRLAAEDEDERGKDRHAVGACTPWTTASMDTPAPRHAFSAAR